MIIFHWHLEEALFIQHGGDVIENQGELTHFENDFKEKLELSRSDDLIGTRSKVNESGSSLLQVGGIDKQMLINNIKSLNSNGEFVADVKKGTKHEPGEQDDEHGRPYRNHVLER